MNAMDHGVLDVLGQLIRGKKVKLTKTKKTALAAWAVKYVLMNQSMHGRDRRFAIPECEYARFHDERTPRSLMRLWAGYMEPPGKHGGPVRSTASQVSARSSSVRAPVSRDKTM
jgi:hypothetical protein